MIERDPTATSEVSKTSELPSLPQSLRLKVLNDDETGIHTRMLITPEGEIVNRTDTLREGIAERRKSNDPNNPRTSIEFRNSRFSGLIEHAPLQQFAPYKLYIEVPSSREQEIRSNTTYAPNGEMVNIQLEAHAPQTLDIEGQTHEYASHAEEDLYELVTIYRREGAKAFQQFSVVDRSHTLIDFSKNTPELIPSNTALRANISSEDIEYILSLVQKPLEEHFQSLIDNTHIEKKELDFMQAFVYAAITRKILAVSDEGNSLYEIIKKNSSVSPEILIESQYGLFLKKILSEVTDDEITKGISLEITLGEDDEFLYVFKTSGETEDTDEILKVTSAKAGSRVRYEGTEYRLESEDESGAYRVVIKTREGKEYFHCVPQKIDTNMFKETINIEDNIQWLQIVDLLQLDAGETGAPPQS
jgi:hypothetical protein